MRASLRRFFFADGLARHFRAATRLLQRAEQYVCFRPRTNSRLRVALRVAQPSAARRRVQLHGRVHRYAYRGWVFNFHHRGHLSERYCDVVICLPVTPDVVVDLATAYVLPWETISRKTFTPSRRPYAGRYAAYRNAWTVFRSPDPDAPIAA